MKRKGERGSPCHRPRRQGIHLPGTLFKRTMVFPLLKMQETQALQRELKTATMKDPVQAWPFYRVKCFLEVELKHRGGNFAFMAAAEKASCIHKVLGDTPPMDEASLIRVNQGRDVWFEVINHYLGEKFHWTVL